MSRFLSASLFASFVVISLGCGGMGGMGGGGGYENQKACKGYVEKQNGLKCMKDVQLNADDMCPESLDLTPKDMTPYYECMRKNAKCNGKLPDLAGQSECASML